MSAELQRAEALIDLHRPDEAIPLAVRAGAQDPDDPAPRLVAARAHLKAGRLDDAATAARHALSLEPESWPAMHLLGIVLSSQGDEHQARYWTEQALAVEPNASATHALLAGIDSDAGHHGKAIAEAEEAVKLDPDLEYAHLMLGLTLAADGRHAAAEQALRHTLQLDPTNATALAALGETLAARGRPQDASELLSMAARNDVRDESIHQDMVRYVRRAAWGLATWPVIIALGVLTLVQPLLAVAPVGLYVARRRRLHRFPPEVRRLLTNRSRTRAAFEVEGGAGFRPWWWHLIARTPLAARTLACWLIWIAAAGVPGPVDLIWALFPAALTAYWWSRRRKSLESHPLYSA